MNASVLVVSDKTTDWALLDNLLGPKGFSVVGISVSDAVEQALLTHEFEVILADFDQAGDRFGQWLDILRSENSKSCFILYGENGEAEKVSEMLQTGAYGFVPRARLSKRIYETILGGIENRKAFIQILRMMNELKDVNHILEREKENLRQKNRELDVINRISKAVAYDLNWDRILPRIIDAGLLEVIRPSLVGLLYRIGGDWRLAVHSPDRGIEKKRLDKLTAQITQRFCARAEESLSTGQVSLQLYPGNANACAPVLSSEPWFIDLCLVGKPLGMLVVFFEEGQEPPNSIRELMSTISNMLAMSLKNAQEYHKLKEMAVKDVLTGVFNRKGFETFIRQEFQRSKRHRRPLSLVMIDVDNFKAINDSHGHPAGDFVLCRLAGCLKKSLRQTDILARYGGDEFVVLLPDTELKKARMLVRRIVDVIEAVDFEWKSHRIQVAISCGISTTVELEASACEKELLSKADARLYQSKRSPTSTYCQAEADSVTAFGC